ncbi:hypothetical protein HNR65_001803 [Desulfosalsimonas propionicica]|uniref:O-antigen ligase-like membrane protein n=1 Tax=Desulfosalsimonas propionicica TaxID=332175 RepID=A0A7W0C969_9BACT|nr:hypothetical protein [Desulfosalsimonas propionicica]MBA2881476.1 hypothetical protein [Desulfosalsimonas propionicica]
MPEILILFLFSCALLRPDREPGTIRVAGFRLIVLFIGWTVLAGIATGQSTITVVLFLRVVLRFYVLFLAIINLEMSDREIKIWIAVLAALLFLQVPVAAVRMIWEGQGEQAVGTYTYGGGGLSTAIPMFMTGYLLVFYTAYRRWLPYLIGIVAFAAFGIIGGKRATFLTVPLAGVFALYVVHSIGSIETGSVRNKIFALVILGLISFTAMKFLPSLNPENRVQGRVDISYAADHAFEYSFGQSQEGATTGRMSTTIRALSLSSETFHKALFGFGPGSMMKSRFGVGMERKQSGRHAWRGVDPRTGIVYGMTGFAWLLLQVGYPGTLLWFTFLFFMFRTFKRAAALQNDPFWQAISLGVACHMMVVLFISGFYNAGLVMGDLGTFLVYFILALGFLHAKNEKAQT